MGVIRSFIAVDLSNEVLGRLESVYHQLKQRLPGAPVRWTPVMNIHLTLKFLGDVSEANLRVLYEILKRESAKQAPFEIRVSGIGAFPSLSRPHVIWVGVQASPDLASLQHAIDIETARLGYASDERSFSPHLTLGRVGRSATAEEASQIGKSLSAIQVRDLGISPVQAVHFYRSDLNPQGSVYTRLYSAPLCG